MAMIPSGFKIHEYVHSSYSWNCKRGFSLWPNSFLH